MPDSRLDAELWPHRQRLPLGDGHSGRCMAPGRNGVDANEAELKDFCNIGYAKHCPHLPTDRAVDVVRFSVARDGGSILVLHWVTEREYLPVEHGTLEYDASTRGWLVAHENPCVQRMAECYVQTYLARHPRQLAVAGKAQ